MSRGELGIFPLRNSGRRASPDRSYSFMSQCPIALDQVEEAIAFSGEAVVEFEALAVVGAVPADALLGQVVTVHAIVEQLLSPAKCWPLLFCSQNRDLVKSGPRSSSRTVPPSADYPEPAGYGSLL